MRKTVLTMLSIFMLSITTTAFSSGDISGEYKDLVKDKSGDSGGSITIKQSTDNEFDVAISSFASMRQGGFTYNYCATLLGKGKIIDGVLVVKNTAKDLATNKSQDVFTRIYFNKHHDIEKYIDSHKNDKRYVKFIKRLNEMTASQIAIMEVPEPINHGGYEVSGREECDRGGGISTGIFTKSGMRKAAAQAAPPTRQTAKPSFDCAKASNAVERAICTDPALAELDVQMASQYKQVVHATADKKALKADQRRWLQQMHSQCADGAFQCIQQHYRERLTQLKQSNTSAPAPTTVTQPPVTAIPARTAGAQLHTVEPNKRYARNKISEGEKSSPAIYSAIPDELHRQPGSSL